MAGTLQSHLYEAGLGNVFEQYNQGKISRAQAEAALGGRSSGGGGDLWGQYQSRLQPLTQQSESLLKDYLAMSAQVPTFQQKLLDAIKQAGQYPSHAAMRAEYAQQPNLTPMAIEALVSQRGQSTRGTIQDLISRAYGGFQSDVASRQAAAQLAQQQRQNLLEQYGLASQAKQTAWEREQAELKAKQPDYLTLGEGQTLYDPATMKALYTAPKTYKPTGGGTDLSWLIDILGGEDTGETGTAGQEPAYSPSGGAGAFSSDGQWYFDGTGWVPVID